MWTQDTFYTAIKNVNELLLDEVEDVVKEEAVEGK